MERVLGLLLLLLTLANASPATPEPCELDEDSVRCVCNFSDPQPDWSSAFLCTGATDVEFYGGGRSLEHFLKRVDTGADLRHFIDVVRSLPWERLTVGDAQVPAPMLFGVLRMLGYSSLKELTLENLDVTGTALPPLLEAVGPDLNTLRLHNVSWATGDAWLGELQQWLKPGLKVLSIAQAHSLNFSCEQVRVFPALTTLDLSENPELGERGLISALCPSKYPALQVLALRNAGMETPSGVCSALAAASVQLEELDLSHNSLRDTAGAPRCDWPSKLNSLNLSFTELEQEHCFTFDRVLGPGAAQVLKMLFEEALPLCSSGPVLSTLGLVQISPSGQTWDLLSPCLEDLSVLDVAPLGLVVKDASEVEVSDAQAASELYLKAAGSESRDCPLVRVLAGEAAGEEVEGSLPWIVSWLLEGNTYTSLLLRLDPQGEAGRRDFLGSGLHRKYALRHSEEQAHQAPDVALQFSLAQARRQRLREEHQIWIQKELKHLEHQEEVACKHTKSIVEEEACEEKERQWQEQTVLKLQVEALQAERDMAEHDLVTLYDLYVQATRARTCHLLQVFQAWQRLWEEKAVATEHHHRSLLAGVLQDTIDLALKTQELQARNEELEQSAGAGVLPREEPDQEHYGTAFLCPHSRGPQKGEQGGAL
ncbi:hypothetical protein STEG23_013161 [Scotinomys teguina]